MIGFIENNYSILNKFEVEEDGLKLHFEIRQEEGQKIDPKMLEWAKTKGKKPHWHEEENLRYIAIYSKGGKCNNIDRLYFYKDDKNRMDEYIRHDWVLLIRDYKLGMKFLKCSSVINHHVDEYTRDGELIMW